MFLFPDVSPGTLARESLPYLIGFVAVLAMIIGYFHFTDSTLSEAESLERERYDSTAEHIVRLFEDDEIRDALFIREVTDGIERFILRPRYSGLFGISEFELLLASESGLLREYSIEDSIALVALETMIPAAGHARTGKDWNLVVYLPGADVGGSAYLARLSSGRYLDRQALKAGSYNVFLVAAAVIVLVLIPGLFLKLADIRRQIERSGYYGGSVKLQAGDGDQNGPAVSFPDILESSDFPAVFRLDERGAVVYMNGTAGRMADITGDDITGALFHELPCFDSSHRSRIEYPSQGRKTEFTAMVTVGTGESRDVSFNIEKPESSGYVAYACLSGYGRGPSGDEHDGRDREPSWDRSVDLIRARELLSAGKRRFSESKEVIGHLDMLLEVLGEDGGPGAKGPDDAAAMIEIFSELEAISSALNDVLPDRASIELDAQGLLPEVECSREDFTMIMKNLVFHSLESNKGTVRIRMQAREVPSPVSDHVFSAGCDRTVSRSVAVAYTDGSRIPVVLKEALLDPETDQAGIKRDYGSHISFVAEVLSRLECHPVFTETPMGTTLNLLFPVSEEQVFEYPQPVYYRGPDLGMTRLAVCDASRAVRESVSEALTAFGMEVMIIPETALTEGMSGETGFDFLILDRSVLADPLEESLGRALDRFPGARIILTGQTVLEDDMKVPHRLEGSLRMIRKPYSIDEILNIIELADADRAGDVGPVF